MEHLDPITSCKLFQIGSSLYKRLFTVKKLKPLGTIVLKSELWQLLEDPYLLNSGKRPLIRVVRVATEILLPIPLNLTLIRICAIFLPIF